MRITHVLMTNKDDDLVMEGREDPEYVWVHEDEQHDDTWKYYDVVYKMK